MVDFHKGFEEYKSLGKERPVKKEGELSLSDGRSNDQAQRWAKGSGEFETLYSDVRAFVRRQFDFVREGMENKLDFRSMVEIADRISTSFENSENPGSYIRLFFEHDEYQENYIYSHSVNVCFMCLRIGLELNFSGKKLREMAVSGLFHDIGMMKISPEIWNREGSLSDEEYKKVKDHPLFGEGMFTNIDDLTEVIPLVIGQHQEKIDGSGYPGHLTIDNIHYLSRLISLVDRYETQTHRRKWKKKVLPDKAIQDLLDNQAGKFDPHFLKALLRVVSIYPEGCYVRISSGEICEVIKTNKAKPMRPIVMMLYDNSKNRMPGGKVLDLSKQVLVHVDKCVDPSEFQI